jgi:hypothetical protein
MTTIEHGHDSSGQQPPVTNRAHPRLYTILIALTLWFILAVWAFSGGGGLVDYLLFVVSAFLCVALGLQLIMFRVGGGRATQVDTAEGGDQPSLRDWLRWDYDTSTGRLAGSSAAAQILLPIAAAAIGMTAIGIIFHVAGG